MTPSTRSLPPFPWDRLAPAHATAKKHPDGCVDLSVGTPIDSTPTVIQQALIEASDSPGYPATFGTPQLREIIADWYKRRRNAGAVHRDGVLPTIGSKEFVAMLPSALGLGPESMVVIPEIAYPTYDIGARLCGAVTHSTDDVDAWAGNAVTKLVWLNSPSNPTGAVASKEYLTTVVRAARDVGAVVASDECYASLVWEGEPAASILDDDVCEGSHEGLLAVYSLSKQSTMAGYRAAFVAGDPALVASLLEIRKHSGLMVPAPVQNAMIAALADDRHAQEQRARYSARRVQLVEAFTRVGFRIDHSQAGLYLWATLGEDCWTTVNTLAELGILVAPGEFYGPAGQRHIRVALTASDADIASAAERVSQQDFSSSLPV